MDHFNDAMNKDPDYSAAYVVLKTDRPDGIQGHGLTFTCGRGTEVVVAAVNALRPLVVGQSVAAFTGAPGAFPTERAPMLGRGALFAPAILADIHGRPVTIVFQA